MATIKLQPSGKVVIKDGKVSCGCCCGCLTITIPPFLREIFENATSGTVWGYNSNEFLLNPNPDVYWTMDWFFPAPPFAPYNILVETAFLKNGCYFFRFEYIEPTDTGLGYGGNPEGCFSSEQLDGISIEKGTFTINGEGEFNYFYFLGPFLVAPPVPNLVIS